MIFFIISGPDFIVSVNNIINIKQCLRPIA